MDVSLIKTTKKGFSSLENLNVWVFLYFYARKFVITKLVITIIIFLIY